MPCSGLALYAPPQARVTCGISRYRGRFLLLIDSLFRLFFLQGTRKKKQANGDEMAGGGGLGGGDCREIRDAPRMHDGVDVEPSQQVQEKGLG